MTSGSNDAEHRKRVQKAIKKAPPNTGGILGTISHWINSVANHLPGFLQGPFRVWSKIITFGPTLIIREWTWIFHTLERVESWLLFTLPKLLRREFFRALHALERWVRQQLARQRALSWRLYYLAVTYALNLVAHERRARIKADEHDQAQARAWDKALHHQIEREAVSGYRASRFQRDTLIQRLADLIVTEDPLVKRLVRDLVSGALDLASVDDPLLRIAVGFLIKRVIDRLGVDKPIGQLLQRLLAPILGTRPPNGLSSVIADLCARADQAEGQWVTFMEHGGPEVEQAGDEWKALASPLIDAGLLAFFGLAVADPAGWATAVDDTLGAVISDTLTEAVSLITRG